MKKITRRNFLIASGKTVGTLAAASAFMGCASPEQAENCFPRSAMPVRTDDRLTAIDDIVENYMGQGYFPGATIVVARGGKIVYEKAYGYAMLNDMGVRLDDPRPMQMDTMFDMASCTKIMATTQSIMKLYSEGKIDLNATVASYIPEFAKTEKKELDKKKAAIAAVTMLCVPPVCRSGRRCSSTSRRTRPRCWITSATVS